MTPAEILSYLHSPGFSTRGLVPAWLYKDSNGLRTPIPV